MSVSITVHRYDGGMRVHPAPPYITEDLRYWHREMKVLGYRKKMVVEDRQLFTPDGTGGVFTLSGFYTRVCELIEENGDTVDLFDERTPLGEPNWARIRALGLREGQVEPTAELIVKARTENGVANAVGGFGKTMLQAACYAAWSNLRTVLAIPIAEVVKQTAKDFKKWFPEKTVGIMGCGYHDTDCDIIISTFASLKMCPLEKTELLLIDEIQSCTADTFQETFTTCRPGRIIGFTATDTNLSNNADKLLVGMFGPRHIYIDNEEGQDRGAIVPGYVYFVRTPQTLPDPQKIKDYGVLQKKKIKLYEPRNKLIGRIAAKVPPKWGCITFVDHITDHLVELYKHMPVGTRFFHRNSDRNEIGSFALSPKEQDAVVASFKNNEFQHLMATDSARAGVSVNNIRVVIQASGGTSSVELRQEAYRGTRIMSQAECDALGVGPKTHFILVDVWDCHDPKLEAQSRARMKIYQREGWSCQIVDHEDDIDWFCHQEKTL